jgi:hypothetical protein
MPTFMPSQQCEDTEISDDNERLVWTISPGKDFSVHSLSWKMLTYLMMVSGFSTVYMEPWVSSYKRLIIC